MSAIQLSHILIAVPEKPTEAQVSAAKEEAAAAIQRVNAGEAFATVAGEVSDDASTKATGGELGWFERGTLSPEWEAVVFSMEKGEIRGPISGPKGLHVAHVVVDGAIDGDQLNRRMPQLKERLGPDGMLAPDAIAEAYWQLHTQPRSTWTLELDLRPWKEGF